MLIVLAMLKHRADAQEVSPLPELIRQPVGKRYWIRRDGKDSAKLPEATASQIAERIRRWPVSKS